MGVAQVVQPDLRQHRLLHRLAEAARDASAAQVTRRAIVGSVVSEHGRPEGNRASRVAACPRDGFLCPLWRERTATTDDQGADMPLYLDVHNVPGVSYHDAVEAHQKDLERQEEYHVTYKQFWVDESAGKIFCLVEAPDADAATRVHREAHGLVADEIHEVREG
jgi:Nickel responsive protein SCO4226-like